MLSLSGSLRHRAQKWNSTSVWMTKRGLETPEWRGPKTAAPQKNASLPPRLQLTENLEPFRRRERVASARACDLSNSDSHFVMLPLQTRPWRSSKLCSHLDSCTPAPTSFIARTDFLRWRFNSCPRTGAARALSQSFCSQIWTLHWILCVCV